MRKILVSLLAVSGATAFAVNNNLLQQFDNQYNLGYGMGQSSLQNGAGQTAASNTQYLSLEVERLFDMGLWMDVNATMATSSTTNQPYGTYGGGGSSQSELTQNPNLGGINAKVGYAFPLLGQHLQITPYALAGRNTNLAMSTLAANTPTGTTDTPNIVNDVFYTGGVGGRIEYRINKAIMIYGDQLVSYNWDQSGPVNGNQPQNNMLYTTTLGAKFNIVKNFQIGVNGFYNNYQQMANATRLAGETSSVYQMQSGAGGLVSVGLTY